MKDCGSLWQENGLKKMIYRIVNIQDKFRNSNAKITYLLHYSDTYIVIKGAITVECTTANDRINIELAFKNNGPFSSCISNVNNAFIDNLEDLGIFIAMYIPYSDSYSMTSGRWNEWWCEWKEWWWL